ncbi:MAG: hypothetical protein R3C61_12625 [Bacteroidia bacterium]
MMYSLRLLLITFLFLTSGIRVFAQDTRRPLFEAEDIVKITITANMESLLKDREEERSYHPAVLSYTQGEGNSVEIPLRLRVRGNFRRQKSTCDFPPLLLNFDTLTQNTIFEGQNKLKLVTHCKTKSKGFDQYVLAEYLIYKMYNQLTDSSFRVRLVQVVYQDSAGKSEPLEKFGFFIEDEDQVATRMGGRILEVTNVHPDKTNYIWANHLAVFEYMVGNTDWSISGLHNIRLVMMNPAEPPVAVPYDFDWAGFVNTPYALPNPELGIVSVKDRLFRGFCRTEEEFAASFQLFQQKKEVFLQLIEGNEWLDSKSKTSLSKYILQFYDILDNPKSVDREFYQNCRTTK